MSDQDSAIINLDRRGFLNYEMVRGDSFSPDPVLFIVDGVNEDFSSSLLKLQIYKDGVLKKTLTDSNGISVASNALTFSIAASDMADWICGMYHYDLQKTTGIKVETILAGTILLKQDITV